MEPWIVTFIAILTFAGGLALGYIEGWGRGSKRGYHVGWMQANAEIRRVAARARGMTDV